MSVDWASSIPAVPLLSADDRQFLLALARRTLTSYLAGQGIPEYRTDSPALLYPRASFVTLRRRDTGELRGCRGERLARRPLVDSVVRMAIASAVDDPRFEPVQLAELPELEVEISALGPVRPIRPEEVVVGRHGLVVSTGRAIGLLLPQVAVAYGWDREQFLRAACQKAGLAADAWRSPQVTIEAFEAEVWGEAPARHSGSAGS